MGVGTFDKITEICYEYAILVLSGDGAFRTPLLSAPHCPRFFLGHRFLGCRFLGRRFLGRSFLGRRFLGRCFLGRRFLRRRFLGRRFLGRCFLGRRSSFSRSSFSRHPYFFVRSSGSNTYRKDNHLGFICTKEAGVGV